MNCLHKLFSMLTDGDSDCAEEEGLFGLCGEESVTRKYEQADLDLIANYCSNSFNLCALGEPARNLFELSINAFDSFIHAWMSELPVEKEIVRFGRRVIVAGQGAGSQEEKRRSAEMTASDRADSDTLSVMTASDKVHFEIHRMMGLLRFSPDEDGIYIAKCAPDTLVIPALAEYFTMRFGETGWAVFDEKRGLSLRRLPGEQAKILVQKKTFAVDGGDEWEDLWRHYHKIINNESRKNPGLQRQLMPKRYWKYLPEM
jgi:probable DNA metabolism protein